MLRPSKRDLVLLASGVWPALFHNRRYSGIRDSRGVAFSMLERGYSKAIVVTDGYADMEEGNAEKLKEKNVSILAILLGEEDECEALEPFGPVVKLGDVVEACGSG